MNIFGLGTAEILLIVFVLLLFFGKDKLPGLARSIGDTFKELRSSLTGTNEGKSNNNAEAKNGDEPKNQ